MKINWKTFNFVCNILTGQKWHTQRKLLTPVFHYNMLENYLHTVLTESNVLVQQLQKEVNHSFNIVPYMKLAAMDIICSKLN